MCVWGWACGCQACVHTCASLVRAHMSIGCCVKGRGSEISGGRTPGWGSGSRREVSAVCDSLAHPVPQGPCRGGGRGALCGSWGLRTWAGASPISQVGRLGLGGPCSLSRCHPAHLPLPPTPAWTVQSHKALFMPGEWPGGREPQRAAGGGEEEVAHEAREHLEAFEGGPAAAALRAGVGH